MVDLEPDDALSNDTAIDFSQSIFPIWYFVNPFAVYGLCTIFFVLVYKNLRSKEAQKYHAMRHHDDGSTAQDIMEKEKTLISNNMRSIFTEDRTELAQEMGIDAGIYLTYQKSNSYFCIIMSIIYVPLITLFYQIAGETQGIGLYSFTIANLHEQGADLKDPRALIVISGSLIFEIALLIFTLRRWSMLENFKKRYRNEKKDAEMEKISQLQLCSMHTILIRRIDRDLVDSNLLLQRFERAFPKEIYSAYIPLDIGALLRNSHEYVQKRNLHTKLLQEIQRLENKLETANNEKSHSFRALSRLQKLRKKEEKTKNELQEKLKERTALKEQTKRGNHHRS